MMQFGYYGKTIHRGDFVRFNLPQTFVNVWDDWLQLTLFEGEAQHAENWSAIYQNSPAYRFGLSAGIAGEQAWAGVVWPSTDKVGRRFPFCLALVLPPLVNPVTHALALEPAWQTIENLGAHALQQDFDFDSLQGTMAEISASLEADVDTTAATAFSAADPASSLAILANSRNLLTNHAQTASLLAALLEQTWFSYSVWQPLTRDDASRNEDTTLLACGLPLGSTALSLFDQAWPPGECGKLRLAQVDAQPLQRDLTAMTATHIAKDETDLATEDRQSEIEDPADSTAELVSHDPEPAEASSDGASTDGASTDGASTDGASTDGASTDGVNTDGVSTDGVSTSDVDSPVQGDEVPFEFRPTEKLPPNAIAGQIEKELEPEVQPRSKTPPVVERLELDEEPAEHNPWDND